MYKMEDMLDMLKTHPRKSIQIQSHAVAETVTLFACATLQLYPITYIILLAWLTFSSQVLWSILCHATLEIPTWDSTSYPY